MTTHVLLLGRTPFDLDKVRAAVDTEGVVLTSGTSLADVEAIVPSQRVDHVVMGAGIPLDDRLSIVRHVMEHSDATTVHMKDRASGKAGMMPFVHAILTGLRTARDDDTPA